MLDVACGTGIITREIAHRLVGPSHIVSVDINPAMIEVARRNMPAGSRSCEFVVASVDDMPFKDAAFDVAFCQQGLQFFPDQATALAEIRRVSRNGANLCVTCWAAVPQFFQIVSDVLGRHLDDTAARKAVEPFMWNDGVLIRALVEQAGFECPAPTQLRVDRKMPFSARAVRNELLASPNEPALRQAGEVAITEVVEAILEHLSRFQRGDDLIMPQTAHLFWATAV
ncbi:methyltransferase domain-containing protein [Defluviimonas sp. WL0002]|uniref:Methyltransferase domain-containing protein n=1 Tax=Albidovulum marisflavi TaxID=2984159 RepID=A0ABT2ZC72_9RHOB|nr:methyltransferase domain-containing protein [Defluviimonas sp. WL0002]MCV2868683.1 methyltransferase domain-containing protein [Defluviimonas sp. WL0002]